MDAKHYRTIVVGTDGSELAGVTVERAATLAARESGELVIVCAWSGLSSREDAKGRTSMIGETRVGRVQGRTAASDAIASATAIATGLGAVIAAAQLVDGEPAQALLETARQHNADLIVLGALQNVTIADRLLGTTASEVVRKATQDVLLVRPNAATAPELSVPSSTD